MERYYKRKSSLESSSSLIYDEYPKQSRDQRGGKSFVVDGFSSWKKKERLQGHVGGVNSSHNQAWRKFQYLLNQKQHIETVFSKLPDEAKSDYRVRLTASTDCIRLLLRQGISLHGHDEFEDSSNQGNFLELLMLLSDQNENLRAVLSKDVPEHLKLTASSIQKDIVNAIAVETTNAIVRELGDGMFSIAVEDLFSTHIEDISRLHGQSYDDVNNIEMQGELNKFTTLIMEKNENYYVHCFAHKLELTLVEAAKSHIHIAKLFYMVSKVVKVVGAPCNHQDVPREK
ncbi:hypothetical protein ACSBR1_012668 [Camellia fascicularis]